MKFVWAVLHVVLVVTAFCGSALSNVVGGDLGSPSSEGGDLGSPSSEGGDHICGIPLGVNQTAEDIPLLLVERLAKCLLDFQSVEVRLNSSHTVDQYRQVIKDECDKLPIMSACATDLGKEGDNCLTASQSLNFKVQIQYYKTLIRAGCENHGERIARIVEEFRKLDNDENQKAVIKNCIIRSDPKEDFTSPASQMSLSYYTTMHSVKQCTSERAQGQSVLIRLVESIIDDVLQQLTCIHPETQLEVPCHSLVTY